MIVPAGDGNGHPVVKVRSLPQDVPAELFAQTLKWYSVLIDRPVIAAVTAVGIIPATGEGLPGTVVP